LAINPLSILRPCGDITFKGSFRAAFGCFWRGEMEKMQKNKKKTTKKLHDIETFCIFAPDLERCL